MGSLQAYEMDMKPDRKAEDKALKAEAIGQKELQKGDANETNVVLILKDLNKLLQQILYRRSHNKDQKNFQKHSKRIQCWECGEIGHLQYECANTKRNKSKPFNDEATQQNNEELNKSVTVNYTVFKINAELEYHSHAADQVMTSIVTPGENKKTKRYTPICHYCRVSGCIQPKCLKLKRDLNEGR